MILYARAARAVPSALAALLSQIEVLLGPLWVWLFLGEAFGAGTAIGGAIVLVALVANTVMTRQGSNQT
jgi:drug/metabolite transporter (DMT)-like permease